MLKKFTKIIKKKLRNFLRDKSLFTQEILNISLNTYYNSQYSSEKW